MPDHRKQDVEVRAPLTRRETLGNMLSEAKNPEATPSNDTLAKFRGLMAERQSSQVPMDRRPSTMRSATGGERVGAYVQSLLGLLAKQPVGRVTDALKLTAFDEMANRPAPQTSIAMMPDFPGMKMAKLLEGEAARALTGGFYSRVDEAATLLPPKGVKAESLINTLKKAPSGVSPEELDLRKLAEFATSKRGQTITPADLTAHLEANPAPFPEVKTLGGLTPNFAPSEQQVAMLARYERLREEIDKIGFIENPGWMSLPTEMIKYRKYRALADKSQAITDSAAFKSYRAGKYNQPPKHPYYQVPGGENYRETLLKMPETLEQFKVVKHPSIKDKWAIQNPDGSLQMNGAEPAYWSHKNVAESIAGGEGYAKRGNFTSSHYPDPNILVHTRANERTLPTGERGRFLEEIQSDWHQKGAKIGYRGDELSLTSKDRAKNFINSMGGNWDLLTIEQQQRNIELAQPNPTNPNWAASFGRVDPVPDAPFKENWQELGLKQQLIEAANDPKIEWIGFTGAKTQIGRWGTERVAWEAAPGGGFKVSFESQVGGNALGGDIGEEALRRGLIKNPSRVVHSIDDLKKVVGGSEVKAEKVWKRIMAQPEGGIYKPRSEGMTQSYDVELPNKLRKILKPFGGTVDLMELSAGGPKDWIAKLTPEMKARIKEGLPLMGVAGLTLGNVLGKETQETR